MPSKFLAIDLGAQSGRAILGRLSSGVLEMTEIHRFANEPIRGSGSLSWNTDALWSEVCRGIDAAGPTALESVGVDTWGVDYVLLDERGALVEPARHYRDPRNRGAMERVVADLGRDRIYDVTGVQIVPINTLFQLDTTRRTAPESLDRARTLLLMPDWFNYRLSGRRRAEYTIASTTQCVDIRRRAWSADLLSSIGVSDTLFAPLVEPGTVLGPITAGELPHRAGTPVVATASHDTASAFAAVPGSLRTAVLSSGTWSLLGAELPAPMLSAAARDSNFTNEGGVCGTIRFLKNVTGLWLLEACRQSWAADGRRYAYGDLLRDAAEAPPFRSLVDPDHESFLGPDDMPSAIDRFCRRTDQPVPDAPAAYVRAIFESLACKYKLVLDSLEHVTGVPVEETRIVGGGSRNSLLNQFTADATARRVVAGPTEATALGNIAVQMLATGAAGSLAEARAVIDRSFPVERFEPRAADRWDAPLGRFKDYVEAGCA